MTKTHIEPDHGNALERLCVGCFFCFRKPVPGRRLCEATHVRGAVCLSDRKCPQCVALLHAVSMTKRHALATFCKG